MERFFVAGVLHDIGRPIIYTRAPDDAAKAHEAAAAAGIPLFEGEQRVFGFHHGAVGALLMERWRLPSMLVEIVAWHHAPRLAPRYPVEAATIHVADVIANALGLGSSGERNVPGFDSEAWSRLDLSPPLLPGILKQVESQFGHAVEAIMGPI